MNLSVEPSYTIIYIVIFYWVLKSPERLGYGLIFLSGILLLPDLAGIIHIEFKIGIKNKLQSNIKRNIKFFF